MVGFYAVYLDGELVGSTNQSARKSQLEIKFISEHAAITVRDFLTSCLIKSNNFPILSNEDMKKKISCFVSTNFSGQQQQQRFGYFEDRYCEVVDLVKSNSSECKITRTGLVVQFSDGEKQIIKCSDFKVPISVDF